MKTILAELNGKQAKEAKDEADRQQKIIDTLERLYKEKEAKFHEIEDHKAKFIQETAKIIADRREAEANRTRHLKKLEEEKDKNTDWIKEYEIQKAKTAAK